MTSVETRYRALLDKEEYFEPLIKRCSCLAIHLHFLFDFPRM